MGNIYQAEEAEAEIARRVFGKGVATVVFYDPNFPREPWLADAYDAVDNRIGSVFGDSGAAAVAELFDTVVGGRGETVKFWLEIDPLECEGHESLDGAHMGETVYCDGSCV